jgi:hypothetical protein
MSRASAAPRVNSTHVPQVAPPQPIQSCSQCTAMLTGRQQRGLGSTNLISRGASHGRSSMPACQAGQSALARTVARTDGDTPGAVRRPGQHDGCPTGRCTAGAGGRSPLLALVAGRCEWQSAGIMNMTAATPRTHARYRSGRAPRFMSMPANAAPGMQEMSRHAKMKPWGMRSPLGLSAGVHRNTKAYIDASNSDWMAPSIPTRGSATNGTRNGIDMRMGIGTGTGLQTGMGMGVRMGMRIGSAALAGWSGGSCWGGLQQLGRRDAAYGADMRQQGSSRTMARDYKA